MPEAWKGYLKMTSTMLWTMWLIELSDQSPTLTYIHFPPYTPFTTSTQLDEIEEGKHLSRNREGERTTTERTREIYPEAELIEKEEILGTKDAENLTIAPGKCAQEDERLEVGTTAPSQDERIQREIQNRSLFDIWMEFVYSERI